MTIHGQEGILLPMQTNKSQAHPSQSRSALPKLEFQKYTLNNGLEVILHRDPSTPVAAVNLWYHVGSKNERPGRSGFAHLFEHMMFQGSKHQDTEYFGPLQEVGGDLNGSTSEDRTNYWEVVPSNHLERALLMEADRLGWLLPAMTQEKLDNQRDVVRNERRQGEGQPYSVFRMEYNRALYPKGHPYDHSVIGEHEDIEAATLDDVKEFFQAYYTPNNATLCVAGDFDVDQTKAWIEQYFGAIPPGPPVQETAVWIPEQTYEKRLHFADRVQLPRVIYIWHTPPIYGSDDANLDLAAKTLAQGRTSRLYKRLVHELQWAQDVAAWQHSGQVSSTFGVQATLKPGISVPQVEAVIDEELEKLKQHGPTEEELERTRNLFEAGFVKGLQRVGGFGGRADLLNAYNHYVGDPGYLQSDLNRYLEATPESICASARKWLHQGRVVFEIHPMGELSAAEESSVDRTKLPKGGETPQLKLPRRSKAELTNGIPLQVMENAKLPLVLVEMILGTGVASDTEALSGLGDLSLDMLLEGTETRDKFAFSEALESLGTSMSTSTQSDFRTVAMVCLKKHLDASMALFAEAVRRPAFPQAELDFQKQQRIVNIRREAENPWTTMSKINKRVIYADHPYALMPGGTEAGVAGMTRDHVVDHAARHFTSGNVSLIAVGDISMEEFTAVSQEHFGDWGGEKPTAPDLPDLKPPQGRTVYLIHKPGDSQSTLTLGHLGVPRAHPDWAAIYTANRVLGGMFSSRLNMNIREDKGYSYGTWSGFSQVVHDGLFYMGGRVQAEVTAPALTEFIKELDEFAGPRPVTAEELEFAKMSVVRGYSGEFETNGEIADALVEQLVFGLPENSMESFPKEIESVSLGQVNRAAAAYFHPLDLAITVLGDLEVIEDSIRSLELGEVKVLDSEGRPV